MIQPPQSGSATKRFMPPLSPSFQRRPICRCVEALRNPPRRLSAGRALPSGRGGGSPPLGAVEGGETPPLPDGANPRLTRRGALRKAPTHPTSPPSLHRVAVGNRPTRLLAQRLLRPQRPVRLA